MYLFNCYHSTCDDGVVIDNDLDNDGFVDEDEIEGCTDTTYVEYNPDATDDDDLVFQLVFSGCTDEEACNFSSTATEDDGSCSYPSEDSLNCEGDW